ncbi:uncharacterized protein LOC135937158 [Cloeon dipterum]|uniref:uncharacterized protein LOC135937158 n=1 Tax=Cloeon dipterum TaxID=197152 RepID=UPI00321FCD2F
MTTPPAQGTTSVTTSSRIPVPETTKSIPISQQISTQHSSALPLKTLSTTDVNEETTEVVKSTLTPTRKTGTPQPALESNETSGDFPGLAEDYRKSQYLVTVLTWLLVCCFISLILSGTVIVWLTLKMRRMQTSLRQISVDNRAEMSVFPEDPIYDDVGPENSNTAPSEEATPENPDESLYAEVLPEPLASADHEYASARTPSPEPYEEPLRLGNTNAGNPSEPVYDEVGKTEQENIYDDVGPGPSSGPSRNENSGRKPTESVQYLEVLPKSG